MSSISIEQWTFVEDLGKTRVLANILRSRCKRYNLQHSDQENALSAVIVHLLTYPVRKNPKTGYQQTLWAATNKAITQTLSNHIRREVRKRETTSWEGMTEPAAEKMSAEHEYLLEVYRLRIRPQLADYIRSATCGSSCHKQHCAQCGKKRRVIRHCFQTEGFIPGDPAPTEAFQKSIGVPRCTAQGWRKRAKLFLKDLRETYTANG